MCVCLSLCVFFFADIYKRLCVCIFADIYKRSCVCVCVCVCLIFRKLYKHPSVDPSLSQLVPLPPPSAPPATPLPSLSPPCPVAENTESLSTHTVCTSTLPHCLHRLVGLVVKASASRAEGPGFESRLRRDFFGVESYQWLKNGHSSGYPARPLAW